MSTAVPTPPSTAVPTPPSSRRAALRSRSVRTTRRSCRRASFRPRGGWPARVLRRESPIRNATPRGMEASPLPSPLPRCAICLSPMRGRRRQPRVDAGDETLAAGADPEPSSPKLRELIVTECGHTFHRSCVIDLQRAQEQTGAGKKSKRSCPLCRKQLAAADSLTPSDKILPARGRAFRQWCLVLAARVGHAEELQPMATAPRVAVARPRIAGPGDGRAPACGGWRDRRGASAARGVGCGERGQRSRRGGEPTGRAAVARSLAVASLAVQPLPIPHGSSVLNHSETCSNGERARGWGPLCSGTHSLSLSP